MKLLLVIILNIFLLGSNSFLQAAPELTSFPVKHPYAQGYLPVSEKHQIFYATYGNPNGLPVIVLHGGPGIGSSDEYSRLFDLDHWHVVMLDQRGAMRSKPFACMEENTTQHSITDIEALRVHLGIEKWVIFGHSWGSCLALAYGQTYPSSCFGFILEGTFLGREQDIGFFRDMGKISTNAYKDFLANFSPEERNHIPQVCYKRIMDSNPNVHMKIARSLMRYQLLNSTNPPSLEVLDGFLSNDLFTLSFMRALVHYAINDCFLQPNQILINIDKINHLPSIIVHGSLDTVCPIEQSHILHENWSNSQLWTVEGAGHSWKESVITAALVKATNSFIRK